MTAEADIAPASGPRSAHVLLSVFQKAKLPIQRLNEVCVHLSLTNWVVIVASGIVILGLLAGILLAGMLGYAD